MARVQVSFKNNDKELKLYDEVMRAYDKSAFIKECIRFYLDNSTYVLTIFSYFMIKHRKNQSI